MSNYYSRRNFSVVKPFQFLEMPVREQEEEQPSWLDALGKGLGGGLGALKGKPAGERGANAPSSIGRLLQNDPGSLSGTVSDNSYDRARADYESAINAPVKKQSGWKDALYKGATILSNALNPQNQVPVVGWGRAKHNKDVQRAYENYAPQRVLEEQRIADENRASIIREREEANRLRGVDIQRKREADQQKNDYYDGILEDKKRGRELSEMQIEDLRSYRQWLMENGDKNTTAKIRQIDERLKDYDLDRQERIRHNKATEGQAATNETGRNARAADVGERARQRLSQMDAKGKDSAINQAVNRWIQQNKGATPEQIAQVRNRLIELYQ